MNEPLLTADIDLVVDPAPEQSGPGMVVLSFWDPQNRRPTVDLFAEYPMDFDRLYEDSQLFSLAGTPARVASIEHLIAIKRAAGRAKDLEDVARLTELRGRDKS
ncbi:MAG: hypothetical protein WB440_14045 [Steroidobacteraceae bacterium]|jgi:hypothetical protein